MRARFVVLAFCALSFLPLSRFAKAEGWYKQPGTRVALESSGFEFRATLPQGWSFETDQGFIPPPHLASSCRVRGMFYTDLNWDRFVESALRSTDEVRWTDEEDARYILKIDDHQAVSNRYLRKPLKVRDIYIDLSDLQPDSGALWTFEGTRTQEGSDCELQFLAIMGTATITRGQESAPEVIHRAPASSN